MLTLAIVTTFRNLEYSFVVGTKVERKTRDTRAGQMQLAGKERSLASSRLLSARLPGGDDEDRARSCGFSVGLYQ